MVADTKFELDTRTTQAVTSVQTQTVAEIELKSKLNINFLRSVVYPVRAFLS